MTVASSRCMQRSAHGRRPAWGWGMTLTGGSKVYMTTRNGTRKIRNRTCRRRRSGGGTGSHDVAARSMAHACTKHKLVACLMVWSGTHIGAHARACMHMHTQYIPLDPFHVPWFFTASRGPFGFNDIRPCLVPTNQKVFKIFYHINSCVTSHTYSIKYRRNQKLIVQFICKSRDEFFNPS